MFTRVIACLFLLLLLGCNGDNETVHSSSLTPVDAEEELLALLKAAVSNGSGLNYSPLITGGAETQFDLATTGSVSSAPVSSTNLQISGVDEADLIKNDASHLFIAVPASTIYGYATAVSGGVTDVATTSDVFFPEPAVTTSNKIRILKMLSNPVATEVIAELEIGTVDDPPLTGLYMQTNPQGEAEKLIAISSSAGGYWFAYGGWQDNSSLIQIIDVSDPSAPFVERKVEIDGNLIASRRIDNHLYLVTRYSPSLPGYIDYVFDTQTIDSNEQILADVVLGDLMPDISYDNATTEELLSASDCYLAPGSNSTNLYADMITLTVLDLNTPATENSVCFIGATETIFVSQNAAYLATSQYNYSVDVNGLLNYSNNYHTEIHKFRLEGATAVYSGSESVEGHLGWDQDKKSFRMGESDDHLIVATSLGDSWSNTATTKLTVIKQDAQNGFTTINTLPNASHPEKIGKPGEKLYSVRFVDEAAYLVTFRVTDPLYVIDLKNPAEPFIAGELQIDGYSDYLHPLPNGLLLGIGKDAVADSNGGDGVTGAWYQGIKLSLFDVNDWSNPVELNSLVIGERGSESAVLHDHHAFTILPGDGVNRPARIAIPIDKYDTISAYDYADGEPWQWYDWTDTGLYLFEVDTDAINPQIQAAGKIIAEVNDGVNYYASGYNDRSVLNETAAYYIHNAELWSAPVDTLSPIDGPR